MTFSTPLHVGASYRARLVGDVMVLHHLYDPEQAWLPFMSGAVVFHRPHAVTCIPDTTRRREIKNLLDMQANPNSRASIEHDDRLIWPIDADRKQYRLPFEGDMVSLLLHMSIMSLLERKGFPGCDRTSSGEPCYVSFPPNRIDEVEDWCHENCRSYYYHGPMLRNEVFFQDLTEATIAKMMFYEGPGIERE